MDLYCLQRQGKSGISRIRVNVPETGKPVDVPKTGKQCRPRSDVAKCNI